MRERYDIPRNVLDRLAEIGVLTPNRNGYDQDDVKIIEAIASFRAGGYEEALGFTVYDTLRYREALEPLVQEEVRALLDRLAGEVDVERAMEIVAAGVEPCASCSARCTPSCCWPSCAASVPAAEPPRGRRYQTAR